MRDKFLLFGVLALGITFFFYFYAVNKVISAQQKEIEAKQAIINICIQNAELK